MLLRKIFLDHGYLQTLERLAIEDGWITRDEEGFTVDMDRERLDNLESKRDPLRGKMLRLLTLFESVDSYITAFDWSRLIEAGIVSKNAEMLNSASHPLLDEDGENVDQFDYEQVRLLRYSNETAIALLKLFKDQVITQHIRRSQKGFYTRQSRWSVNRNDLKSEYNWIIQHLGDRLPDEKAHLDRFADHLYFTYRSIRDGVYYSCIDGHASFIPSIGHLMGPEPPPVPEIIDDLYYLARTRLSDEVLILPQPRSIAEAVDMKNMKEMSRFRQILSAWLEALQIGDDIAEKKIRLDIAKANKELERLKSIRRFQQSPVNFWINAIGGHIPIFSDVLNAFNTASGLYEMRMKYSSSWVLVLQSKR